ncbi:MAG TPA: ABC transporter permease, partial [Bacteroidetes bacterium]|nr:ABC transporter permease [Bacteroidota bacterium]
MRSMAIALYAYLTVKSSPKISSEHIMFRTYIKVAWRNLLRDRMYAVVNILGLAVGLAVSIVIFLYIQNELTYDSYNKNADQIYRLGSGFLINGEREQMALSSYALGPALLREMQGVESYCRLRVVPVARFTSPYQKGSEDGIVQADSSLFQMFSYKLLKGNPHTCLSRPLSIVINQKLAQKYFGDNDPMGQIMEGGSKRKYTVTGVMQNLPENTHHYFDGVLSYHSLPSYELACVDGEDPSLWAATDYTFLQLEKGFYAQEFNYEFLDFYKAKMAKIGKRINGYYYPILQPLASIHIGSQLDHDMYDAGNMSYIYGFAAIGLFLLLLAGINYMNMATARSVTRAREVGLRKVMGSRRHHLVFQFLGESMLASLIGLLLALALVEIVLELTPFNDLMGKNLKLGLFQNPMLGFGVLGVTFLLGLGSGLYPAIYLSSFLPVRALRLRNRATSRSISLRKVLVIFQFTVSI